MDCRDTKKLQAAHFLIIAFFLVGSHTVAMSIQRDMPYSMVWFYLNPDEQQTRRMLQTVRDLGVMKTQALIYWWQIETLGGNYWKQMGYTERDIGTSKLKALDNYIKVSHELGMRPALRVGTFRVFKGLYHPMDTTGSVEKYCDWLRRMATRYKGKIDHWVIGDEENKRFPEWGWTGSAKDYMEKLFIPASIAIKEGDPDSRISCTAVSSAPATDWIMKVIALGLPRYGDGIAANIGYRRIEDLVELQNMMRKVKAVWPEAKFYANGVGYVEHAHLHDKRQASILAQCMFTLWDIGWNSAPYYVYAFSKTKDTHQNFGIMSLPGQDKAAVYSDAWFAYQTIAHTFYNRNKMRQPDFEIRLRQGEVCATEDGLKMRIAPPVPVFHSYIRNNNQMLLYIAYRKFREPCNGRWDILLRTKHWVRPKRIPILDYKARLAVPHHYEGDWLVIEKVKVSLEPAILILTRSGTEIIHSQDKEH